MDAVQEECVLLDVILFQIRLELFEQICRDLECHGSLVICHIGSSSFFVFVELSDQPGHVLAEGLAGSFLIFTNLCMQSGWDWSAKILDVFLPYPDLLLV